MQPQAERYLDLAQPGRNQWWRYLLGIIIIASSGLWPTAIFAFTGQVLDAAGMLNSPASKRLFRILTAQEMDNSVLSFLVLNLSIIGMIAGLLVALKLLHGRKLLSLITPGPAIDWRRMAYGAAVGFVILATLTLIEHLLFPGRYRLTFNPARFFPFMFAVLLLTPLQAATEELVFRGYLTQGLGLLTRRPIVIAVLTSLLFAVLHLANPEVGQHGVAIMAVAYFLSGLMFATVAMRDGRLELAIGLHAVNNVFTALIANNDGSVLQTESIFMSPMDPTYSLVALLITIAAFHWWMFDRAAAKRTTLEA